MIYINRNKNWFTYEVMTREGWESVSNEDWNIMVQNGFSPEEAPPSKVTRRQLFLWLNSVGITRAMIRAMLTGNEVALIEFDEALEFDRYHPLVLQLGGALGLNEEAIDVGFRMASTL